MLKTDKFDKRLQELADLAKVLSHPARIAILEYLAKCNTCISGDISEEIPLSRTTVSQHLTELKKARLIQGEIEGVKVHYCLDHEGLSNAQDSIWQFFNSISNKKNQSC